ncbi:MAG: DNA gyrase subunit A, partial [Opitutales bacterium]
MANKDEESPEEEPQEGDASEQEDSAAEEANDEKDESPVELIVADGGKFDPEALSVGNGNGNGNSLSDDGIYVDDMYGDWFLDYASYVILERAVPHADDGLKPVQRRILHSMREMEDGRYNKVANVIGNTMKYHPHGDASIADAMVQIGQKELLIDPQGNWGNVLTGDSAAASRYIEA